MKFLNVNGQRSWPRAWDKRQFTHSSNYDWQLWYVFSIRAAALIISIMLLCFGCFYPTYFCVMAKQLFSFSLKCCLLDSLKKWVG